MTVPGANEAASFARTWYAGPAASYGDRIAGISCRDEPEGP